MFRSLTIFILLLISMSAFAQPAQQAPTVQQPELPEFLQAELDVPYAATDSLRQRLDIYRPKQPATEDPLPVVVIIHGLFQNPNKGSSRNLATELVQSGDFAAIAIGYRMSDEARFPAQIHDCKAAIRWIRANAKKYNFDGDHIGVIGSSAGGMLAALLGTSGGVPELEGKLGEHLKVSSRVTCVVDMFGPTDLLTLGGNHNKANSQESRLIGGPLLDNQDAARQASPLTYASADDPPFLFIHGTNDPNVPFAQSEMLRMALEKAGASATLVSVEGGLHGNFRTPEVGLRFREFFDKHLRNLDVEVSSEPIVLNRQ